MIDVIPVQFVKAPFCGALGWVEIDDDEGFELPVVAYVNLAAIGACYKSEEKMVQAIVHTITHEVIHFIARFEIPYYLQVEEEVIDACVYHCTPCPFEDVDSALARESTTANDDYLRAYTKKHVMLFRRNMSRE